jgi:hypothetical protein
MKRITLTLCAAALLLFACNSETKNDSKTAGSDTAMSDQPEVKDKTRPDPCAGYVPDPNAKPMDTAMMNAWMKSATPGDMHAMLAKDDGEWEGEVTHWMDPAAPAEKSKSYASNKMIMGGRFQMSEHSGCFGGMPFEGISLVGYDNLKKVFVSNWIDNMGTMMMHLEGPYDATTKTIRLTGTCTNPMNGAPMKMREEFTYVDENTQKMTMYGPDMTGKEFKTMEIVYKRKK